MTKAKATTVFTQLQVLVDEHFDEAPPLYFPRKHRNKRNFGDVDVISNRQQSLQAWAGFASKFPGYWRNHDSFLFQLLGEEVDIMARPNFDAAKFYYDQSSLGMLVGAVYSYHGFKLGQDGLCLEIYNESKDRKLDEVTLTTSPEEMLGFLGYSYQSWLNGFDSEADVFRFVTDSPYYSFEAFISENRTNRQRKRDNKRSGWDDFRSSEAARTATSASVIEDPVAFAVNSGYSFVEDVKNKRLAEIERSKKVKAVFNGSFVKNELEADGKEIGHVMTTLKNRHEDYEAHVLETGRDEMLEEASGILDLYRYQREEYQS